MFIVNTLTSGMHVIIIELFMKYPVYKYQVVTWKAEIMNWRASAVTDTCDVLNLQGILTADNKCAHV